MLFIPETWSKDCFIKDATNFNKSRTNLYNWLSIARQTWKLPSNFEKFRCQISYKKKQTNTTTGPSTYKVFSWHLLMKPSSRDRHLLTSDNKETLCHHWGKKCILSYHTIQHLLFPNIWCRNIPSFFLKIEKNTWIFMVLVFFHLLQLHCLLCLYSLLRSSPDTSLPLPHSFPYPTSHLLRILVSFHYSTDRKMKWLESRQHTDQPAVSNQTKYVTVELCLFLRAQERQTF